MDQPKKLEPEPLLTRRQWEKNYQSRLNNLAELPLGIWEGELLAEWIDELMCELAELRQQKEWDENHIWQLKQDLQQAIAEQYY